jgi:hypothetical protein
MCVLEILAKALAGFIIRLNMADMMTMSEKVIVINRFINIILYRIKQKPYVR